MVSFVGRMAAVKKEDGSDRRGKMSVGGFYLNSLVYEKMN